jgi:RecJ-like exonuclease
MNVKCQRCKAKGVLNGDLVCPQCNGVGHLTERELIAELVEALEEIVAGNFNCSPHQRFMAAQGVAERALAKAKEQQP